MQPRPLCALRCVLVSLPGFIYIGIPLEEGGALLNNVGCMHVNQSLFWIHLRFARGGERGTCNVHYRIPYKSNREAVWHRFF